MNLTSSGLVALTRSTPVWQRIFPLSQWGAARATTIRIKEEKLSKDASPYHAFLNHPGILVGAGYPAGVPGVARMVGILWTLCGLRLQGQLFQTRHFRISSASPGPPSLPASTAYVYYQHIRKFLQRPPSPDSSVEACVTEGSNRISPTRLLFQ